MFIVQPISSFGDLICKELVSQEVGQRQWDTFEFAVAWVNRSGAERVKEAVRGFLVERGSVRATVGLDFGNTTYEGLCCLLDLDSEGTDITTHVFCDENPACTFHPKVFLFSNVGRARLFVGSNNMTGAGLHTNVETALGFSGALDEDTVRAARRQLAAWRDESDTRTRRLTRELLEQLRDRRYVLTEAEIRDRRNSEAQSRRPPGPPLFGRSSALPPRAGRAASGGKAGGRRRTTTAPEEALLMRVRPRRNGNQIQISIKVLNGSFMNGATEVVLTDGSRRTIGSNAARGGRNTERFEAPGLKDLTNPVARLRWIRSENTGEKSDRYLQFELFDADDGGEGSEIFGKLEGGISTPPVTNLARLSRDKTVLSKPDRASAQWYRLDSD